MGDPTPIASFLNKLQSSHATQTVIGAFDSMLGSLGVAPVGAVVNNTLTITTAAFGQVEAKERILGEIDRQLFLQFLEGQITYLNSNRNVDALVLFSKIDHDRPLCRTKQQQIREALSKLYDQFNAEKSLSAALATQQAKTFMTFLKMKTTGDRFAYSATIDDFINIREIAAIRKILEQLTDDWGRSDGTPFVAQDGWTDLKDHWQAWAMNHRVRVATFKRVWSASGGSRAIDSNPGGTGVIQAYYNELYEVIEGGDLPTLVQKLGAKT